jgi:hypothetical protein
MGWFLSASYSRSELIATMIAPKEHDSMSEKVIAHALRGNVLWSVVEVTAKTEGVCPDLAPGQSRCYIHCNLLKRRGDEWGYDPMDEAIQPCYYSCPLRYLDMASELSPEWRQKVRAYHEKVRKSRKRRAA